MNFENWLSYRYLTSSKGRFLSFLNFISVAGIAVGVMALIVTIGIMTGFGNNIRDKIIGTRAHILVEKETGVQDFAQVAKEIGAIPEVIGSAPYINGNIFLEYDTHAMGLAIRGIDPKLEPSVTKVKEYLTEGSLADLDQNGIVIGSKLAEFFGYEVGDEVTLIAPTTGLSGEGWRHKLKIAGVFTSGMYDLDRNLVLVSLEKAQSIFGYPQNLVSGIAVKLDNIYNADEVKGQIYKLLGYSYLVRTWIESDQNLFEALFLEKWGLFILLTLMVLVASFNIISTLIVTVASKTKDIGVLKAIGVSQSSIRRIFTKQGLAIGLIGTFWGVVAGLGVSYILRTYIKVPEQIYYMDHVPVDLQLFDMLAIVAASIVISFLATIYPSAKASNLEPVEALRYQ